jgi:hypothetical protein
MKMNASQMGQAIQNLFGKKAEQMAQETKFVQRESKLTGSKFLQIWTLGFLQHPKASLNILCQVAEDLEVSITKQGMQQRLTPATVEFLQEMFEHAKTTFQNKVPIALDLLTQFKAVQLVDSSGIALPDSLADEFPAAGGDGPQAGLKLQTVWEFLRGNLSDVILQTGLQPDQIFEGHLSHVAQGVLFLCDLGYFNLVSLNSIAAGKGYFVSRLNTHCILYDPVSRERFDLLAYLHQTAHDRIELNLLVGKDAKLPCRVLVIRLPADVVEERRRKAKANARRKGRTLSAEKLAWLEWNIYITNVPVTMLTLRQVVLIYTLRWQIELLFRLWKSEAQLDRVVGRLRERVLCEIYAKLIGMVLFHFLTAPFRWAKRELSPTKALQTLQRHAIEIAESIGSQPDLLRVLNKLISRWQRFALKDQRRSRLSTCRQIELAAIQVLNDSVQHKEFAVCYLLLVSPRVSFVIIVIACISLAGSGSSKTMVSRKTKVSDNHNAIAYC